MKKTLLPVSAMAICAAVLVGCEWGGVHSGESWNDSYSWANFTGTYKLVNNVETTTTTTTTSTSGTTTTTTTTTNTPVWVSASKSFSVGKNEANATIKTGYSNLKEESVSASCGSAHTWTDIGAGVLQHGGVESAPNGEVNYATGVIYLHFGATHSAYSGTVTFQYKKSSSGGGGGGGGGDDPSDPSPKKKGPPITWLNLNQKGNLLTFQDSNGTTYSGRITGASAPKASEGGYMNDGHIRFTFEAKCTSNSAITLSGTISGDYSGSNSANGGTIANRTIDAVYHNGKSGTSFQAVSGSTVVSAKDVAAAAGTTE